MKSIFQCLREIKIEQNLRGILFKMEISVVRILSNNPASKISFSFASRLSEFVVDGFIIPIM